MYDARMLGIIVIEGQEGKEIKSEANQVPIVVRSAIYCFPNSDDLVTAFDDSKEIMESGKSPIIEKNEIDAKAFLRALLFSFCVTE